MTENPREFGTEAPGDFEKERLLRVQKTLRELIRQAELRLEGLSITEVAKRLGLTRPSIYGRQRILRRLARKNINRAG